MPARVARGNRESERIQMVEDVKSNIDPQTNTIDQKDIVLPRKPEIFVSTGRAVRVQMLGESGVGKTCFIAGLALLNEQTDGRSFVLPTDDSTKSVFDKLRATLSKGRWPAKTSIVEELSFAVVRGNDRVDVHLNDFAGESFSDSMSRGNASEAAKQIQSLVSGADVLVVLLDGAEIDRGGEFAGAPLIQAVFQRLTTVGRGELDVVVVLTKSDLCKGAKITTGVELKQLIELRAPDLARFLQEQNIETQWTPVSVCGPSATDESGFPIYESLAPQGYESIFEQLFKRSRRPRNRVLKQIAGAIVLILFLGVAWTILRNQHIADEGEKIQAPGSPIDVISGTIEPENEPLLRQRYVDEFANAKKEIEASGNIESIALVLKRFDSIQPSHEQLIRNEWKQLKSEASSRKEQLLHKQVVDCQQLQTGDCVPLIGKYLSEFPEGPNADDLRKMLKDINQARYLTARGLVKAVPVASPESLRQKKDAITKFLADYGQNLDTDERAAINAAGDLAIQFVTPRQYHCKLVRTSGLDGPRDHGVDIVIGGEKIATFGDSGDVTEKNWNRSFTVDWKSGQSIQAKLVNYDGFTHDLAYFEDNSPIAISILAKNSPPNRWAEGIGWFSSDFTETRPPFKITFECEELPTEKLQVITDYLLPGDKW